MKDHRIAEVGSRRRAALERAGWGTLESLAAAEPAQLTTCSGIHKALAERIVARARERLRELSDGDLLGRSAAVPVEVADERTAETDNGAATDAVPRAAHKVRSGRRVRRVMERLDQAREHAGEAKKSKERKQARASMRELRDGLAGLRSRLRRGDVSDADWRRARGVLEELEARLDEFLGRRPKRVRMLELGRQVRRAAAALLGS
ncbi:MAG: helix-hairpin-helix domain-containing protein [Myxococcales bacterium]|nr:helix-hairpin-helix domain-containing protein [Myxococcales bacterium]